MKNILMVCLGNICRSPIAEGILRQLARNQQLDWKIDSAGTGSWHIGEAPDKRSIQAAYKLGYDISSQRARHFNAKMFDHYDHIFVMDKSNLRDVLQLAKNTTHENKVQLFLPNDEVTDPYYDDTLFAPVAKQIEDRCKILIQMLRSQKDT